MTPSQQASECGVQVISAKDITQLKDNNSDASNIHFQGFGASPVDKSQVDNDGVEDNEIVSLSTTAKGNTQINSNESKVASDTIFQSLEALATNIVEVNNDAFFADDKVVPHGTNYKDFVLFPDSDSLNLSPIDSNRFFADADATTTTATDQRSIFSTATDSALFIQTDIAHKPKPVTSTHVSNSLYDAVSYETFLAIDKAVQQTAAMGELQQQINYCTSSYDGTLPSPHHFSATYCDIVSSPIETWANTFEHHESFAYRFAQ